MWFFGPNLNTVQTQIETFQEGKGKSVAEKDIAEVRKYIEEQRKNYPNENLERDFKVWEAEVTKITEVRDKDRAQAQAQASNDSQVLAKKVDTSATLKAQADKGVKSPETQKGSLDKKTLLSSISKNIITSCRTGVDYSKHPVTVKAIQKLLIAEGYSGVSETGAYDKATRIAVGELQKMLQKGWFYVSNIDGAFGPATYAAYDDYLNKKTPRKLKVPACNTEGCSQESGAKPTLPVTPSNSPSTVSTQTSSKNLKVYSGGAKDNIGPARLEAEKTNGTVIFKNGMDLGQQVKDKMKALDPALEKNFNDVMTKSKSYTLLWSLLQTDAEMHGSYEGFGGAVKMATRWMDIQPIYFGANTKMLFSGKQEKLNVFLQGMSGDIIKGDVLAAKWKLSKIESELFNPLVDDLLNVVHNAERPALEKTMAKYKSRFDKGDTLAAFEFMADAAKNPVYLNGYISDTVKIAHLTNDILEKGTPGQIDQVLSRNTPYEILGEHMNLPGIDYKNIILSARKKSVEVTGVVDPEFIRQAITKEILSSQKSELLKNPTLKPTLDTYYKYNGFMADLSRTWLSTTAKVAVLSRVGMSAGGGVNTLVGKAGLTGLKWAGLNLVAQTALLTPAMTLASGAMNGQFGESWDKLKDVNTWIESAIMMGAFTAVGKVLEWVKGMAPVTKLWGTIQWVRGGKFLLSGVDFALQAGVMIGVNHVVFNGEFTPEELANAIIFTAMMKSANVTVQKKPNGEIKIEPKAPLLGHKDPFINRGTSGETFTITKENPELISKGGRIWTYRWSEKQWKWMGSEGKEIIPQGTSNSVVPKTRAEGRGTPERMEKARQLREERKNLAPELMESKLGFDKPKALPVGTKIELDYKMPDKWIYPRHSVSEWKIVLEHMWEWKYKVLETPTPDISTWEIWLSIKKWEVYDFEWRTSKWFRFREWFTVADIGYINSARITEPTHEVRSSEPVLSKTRAEGRGTPERMGKAKQLREERKNRKSESEVIPSKAIEAKWSDLKQEYHENSLGNTSIEIFDNKWNYFTGVISEVSPMKLKNGLKYSWEVKNGTLDWKWKITYKDGTIYEWRIVKNGRWGEGKNIFKNGDIFSGTFENGAYKDGVLKDKSGKVIETWKNGEKATAWESSPALLEATQSVQSKPENSMNVKGKVNKITGVTRTSKTKTPLSDMEALQQKSVKHSEIDAIINERAKIGENGIFEKQMNNIKKELRNTYGTLKATSEAKNGKGNDITVQIWERYMVTRNGKEEFLLRDVKTETNTTLKNITEVESTIRGRLLNTGNQQN